MRAFSSKRTAASYHLWLVVAFEILRQVVIFLILWEAVAFLIKWPVVAYGKLS